MTDDPPPTQGRVVLEPPGGALLLVVMSPEGVFNIPLPPHGEVTIGRSPSCDVHINDSKASRVHAALRLGSRVEIIDRASLNGTLVSDRRLKANEPLAIELGAMITIGSTVLVLQMSGAAAKPKRLWSQSAFEARVAEEERLARAEHSMFSILRISPHGSDSVPPQLSTSKEMTDIDVARAERLDEILNDSLRPTDEIGVLAGGVFEILLPRTLPDAARAIATQLRGRLHEVGLTSEVSLVSFPNDGTSAATLEARVRAPSVSPEEDEEPPKSTQFDRDAMDRLAPLVELVASSTINLLILGETGVGKEVMARSIHDKSPRAACPMVTFNCAAFAETLLESELFGHEKGAFTGAVQAKAGLLESAEGGTVFLDEVGEMPLTLQAKLLRVLEQREVQRVGALKPRPIDVRFIAATNRDLEAEVRAKRFREDLYFRLNGMSLTIPPLRERLLSIEPLARAFVAQASELARRPAPLIAPAVIALLRRHRWPGNIRELRNVMERAVLLSAGETITLEHIPSEKIGAVAVTSRSSDRPGGTTIAPAVPAPPPDVSTGVLASLQAREQERAEERKRILDELERCAGNQTKAAKVLGISRRTLVSRLAEYGVPRPRK